MVEWTRRKVLAAGGGLIGTVAMPAVVRSQQGEAIKIGHLAPRTGVGAVQGEGMYKGAVLAIEDINKKGGVLGRPLELVHEDSVNPSTAASKAQRLIEREGVHVLCGETISPSVLAISQVAARNKKIYLQAGANHNELRGKSCNRYMFHIEAMNSIYVNTMGTYLEGAGLVKGKRWYSLTADYSHGQDLRAASQRFLARQGGTFAGDDLVPLDATDFSAYLIKIRQAKPDIIVSNMAIGQVTNFLKQYAEYGMTTAVVGFDMVIVLAWATGTEDFGGIWPCRWHYEINTPSANAFVSSFRAKYNALPTDDSWGDYVCISLLAQAIAETKSTDNEGLISFFEKEPRLDILKSRPGYFRSWDHQLIQEMYTLEKKPKGSFTSAQDMLKFSAPVPGPGQEPEVLAATREENPCSL